MPRFFVDKVTENEHVLTGPDALHIIKSLRMKVNENVTLCDADEIEYECKIKEIKGQSVILIINDSNVSVNEPSVELILYQAIPKSDKMDLIIQKAVELGADKIVPVLTSRCISRPDEKTAKKKIERWQKIAQEAAKQSRRGKIPQISQIIPFKTAVLESDKSACRMLFYENGGKRIQELLNPNINNISIFVGPEGGFADEEIELCKESNISIATLGPRILRTETAPLAAIAVIMSLTGNM